MSFPTILTAKKKTALDFVAYLRANKMSPGWSDVNVWKVVNKGKKLCEIRLNGRFWGEDKKWVVVLNLINMDEYEESIVNAGMQELIWENVFYCKCYPKPGCGGRGKYTFLGREIEGVGGCNRWSSVFRDPDEEAVECMKKLMELEKKARTAINSI